MRSILAKAARLAGIGAKAKVGRLGAEAPDDFLTSGSALRDYPKSVKNGSCGAARMRITSSGQSGQMQKALRLC